LSRLSYLFNRYKSSLTTDEEKKELLNSLTDPSNAEEVHALLLEAWDAFEPAQVVFSEDQAAQILGNIIPFCEVNSGSYRPRRLSGSLPVTFRIAAALLLVLSVGYYFLTSPSPQATSRPISQKAAGKLPVGSGRTTENARLTLADGRVIDLETLSSGTVSSLPGLRIVKTTDGKLVYSAVGSSALAKDDGHAKPEYHMISTPPGIQYQINLADGTKVWLNAASSLRFPTAFSGYERRVELIGEAYFEVARHQVNAVKQPFKVISRTNTGKNQELVVLGTHFNVQAYHNDISVKTTLLEGSVSIKNLNSNVVSILNPGEQSALTAQHATISSVDTEEVMAWKQGMFVFNNVLLIDILQQLEHWYDLEIDYTHIPHTRYQAFISRKVPLPEVISMLELTGDIKFKTDTIQQTGRVRLKVVH
jgi:hypothetical protein